jgi:hypothetical protein
LASVFGPPHPPSSASVAHAANHAVLVITLSPYLHE